MSKAVGTETSSRMEMFSHVTGSHFQAALDIMNDEHYGKADDALLMADRFKILRDMGRFNEALEGYSQLITTCKAKPDLLPVLYYERGRTYQTSEQNTGNTVKALYDYEECISRAPDHYAAHVCFADMCWDIGDRVPAMKSANAAIGLKPDCCYGYLIRARLNMEHKSHDQSDIGIVIRDVEKAIEVGDPHGMNLMPLNWPIFRQVLNDLKNPQLPSVFKPEKN